MVDPKDYDDIAKFVAITIAVFIEEMGSGNTAEQVLSCHKALLADMKDGGIQESVDEFDRIKYEHIASMN